MGIIHKWQSAKVNNNSILIFGNKCYPTNKNQVHEGGLRIGALLQNISVKWSFWYVAFKPLITVIVILKPMHLYLKVKRCSLFETDFIMYYLLLTRVHKIYAMFL